MVAAAGFSLVRSGLAGIYAALSVGSARGQDASQPRSSESRKALVCGPIMAGAGKYPAFTQRRMVIRLLLYRRQRSAMLRNRSPSSPWMGGFVSICDMMPKDRSGSRGCRPLRPEKAL